MRNRPTRSSLQVLIALLVAALLAFWLSGCGNSTTTPASGTFTDVYTNFLGTPQCTQCHTTGQTSATTAGVNLDFTSQANAYATLVTNAATNHVVGGAEPSACKNIPLVTASNPNASYLLAMVISSYNSTTNFDGMGCTPDQTHIQSGYVPTSAEATSLTTWIQNGAQNN